MARVDDPVREEVVKLVQAKAKLIGLTLPEDATLLDEPIDEVRQAICNYCNIDYVPEELKYVWANMVVDYLRWTTSLAGSASGGAVKPGGSSTATIVSSLKEGDTTIGFSADTSSQSSQAGNAHAIGAVLDQVVMNYQDQLNRFRRVVW